MAETFQQILAGGIVLAAVGYIVRHYYMKHKAKTGCAACKVMQAVRSRGPEQKITV